MQNKADTVAVNIRVRLSARQAGAIVVALRNFTPTEAWDGDQVRSLKTATDRLEQAFIDVFFKGKNVEGGR